MCACVSICARIRILFSPTARSSLSFAVTMKTVTKRGVIWPFFVRPLPLPLAKQHHNPPATTTRCNMKNNTLMELSHSYGGKHGQKAPTRAMRRMQRARVKSLRKTRTTPSATVCTCFQTKCIFCTNFLTRIRANTLCPAEAAQEGTENCEKRLQCSVCLRFHLHAPSLNFFPPVGYYVALASETGWTGGRNKRGTVCKRMSVWRRLWRYLTLLQLLLT